MNTITKVALVSASVLSMAGLTACQSTNNVQTSDQSPMMKHHAEKHQKDRLSPEQRAEFAAARQQRIDFNKQIRQACDNKAVGSSVEVKTGDKTIQGTCIIHFKADPKQLKEQRAKYRAQGEQRPMRGELHGKVDQQRGFSGVQRGEPLTDAQRAELVKQYDQRLAERQAQQKAFVQACQGKKDGANTQMKLGEQSINGTCHVRFQPKAPTVNK